MLGQKKLDTRQNLLVASDEITPQSHQRLVNPLTLTDADVRRTELPLPGHAGGLDGRPTLGAFILDNLHPTASMPLLCGCLGGDALTTQTPTRRQLLWRIMSL
jgi:hypothetical protein